MFEAWSSSTLPEKRPSTGCCWWRQVKPCVRPASCLVPSHMPALVGLQPRLRWPITPRYTVFSCLTYPVYSFNLVPTWNTGSNSTFSVRSFKIRISHFTLQRPPVECSSLYYSCCVILSAFHPSWTRLPAPLECEFSLTQNHVIYILTNKWWGDQVSDPVCGGLW